jgi:hypothetical protein
MLFLVDGYNVTRADPATRGLELSAQRDELLRRLSARGASILGRGEIVVVFDAREGIGSAPATFGPVQVRWARDRSADDEIVAIVERTAEKVVLITSDRGLTDRARGEARSGLDVRGCESCFDRAGRGRSRRERAPAPRRDVGIPEGGNAITEELKNTWLEDAQGEA